MHAHYTMRAGSRVSIALGKRLRYVRCLDPMLRALLPYWPPDSQGRLRVPRLPKQSCRMLPGSREHRHLGARLGRMQSTAADRYIAAARSRTIPVWIQTKRRDFSD